MKNLSLLAVLLIPFISNSQNKGTWVFNGELGFTNSSYKNTQGNSATEKTKQFNMVAKVGYVFTKTNLEVGLGFGYAIDESFSYNDPLDFITTSIAPYIKKYFPVNDKFAFHLTGEIGNSKSYLKNSAGNNELDN